MKQGYKALIIALILLILIASVHAAPSENKLKKDKAIEIKENKVIEHTGKGKIIFKDNFDLEIEDVENEPNVFVGEGLIAINSTELPELNKPATVVFENLPYDKTPKILYSQKYSANLTDFSQFCPDDVCSNINYDKETGTLTFDVTGFSSFITASSDCIDFSDERVVDLQFKISERINALKSFHGPDIYMWPSAYGTTLTLTELSKYYWNLDRVDPAPNFIYGIDTSLGAFAESDSPASYDAVFEEFKTWEEPSPVCFTEKSVSDFDKAADKLRWIFIPLPSIKENTFFWTRLHPPFVSVEWNGVKSGSGSDADLSASWTKTESDFDSKELQYNRNIDSCWVYEQGTGRWDSGAGKYYTSKQYASCQLRFDFSSLPASVDIEEAKLFFFMSYGVGGADNSDLIGSTSAGQMFRGYNIIGIDIPENGIFNPEIKSTLGDVKPAVDKDGAAYGKGFEGYVAGVFISPFVTLESCVKDGGEINECYYEMDEYNDNQFVNIGGKICSEEHKWKLCVNDDDDPCGEWKDKDVSCRAFYKKAIKGEEEWGVCIDGQGTHDNCEVPATADEVYVEKTKNDKGTEEIEIQYTRQFCNQTTKPPWLKIGLRRLPVLETERMVVVSTDLCREPTPPKIKEHWSNVHILDQPGWNSFTLKLHFNDPGATELTPGPANTNQVWHIGEIEIGGNCPAPAIDGAPVFEVISPSDFYKYKYKQQGMYTVVGEITGKVTRKYKENDLICYQSTKSDSNSLLAPVPYKQMSSLGSNGGAFGSGGGALTGSNGAPTLNIPPGALGSNNIITINTLDASSFNTNNENFVNAVILDPDGLNFNEPVTLMFNYGDSEVNNENGLDIYLYDNNAQSWVPQHASIDKVKNEASIEIYHFSVYALIELMDTEPPLTTLIVSEPKYEEDEDIFITSNTELTLEATDYGDSPSGVNATYYCVDQTNNCMPEEYITSFTITEEGTNYLRYYSEDSNGNIEGIKSTKIIVDNSPPELSLDINPKILWPPNNKLVDIKVDGKSNDKLSGVASTTFLVVDSYGELNPIIYNFGDIIKLKSSRLGSDKNGRIYIVEATSIDNVGNAAVTTATVIVPHDMRYK